MSLQRAREGAVPHRAVALLEPPNPLPHWCVDFSLGASVYPTVQQRHCTMSSDPASPDCPRIADTTVSDKSKVTRLTFSEPTVGPGWSLLTTHHVGQHIFRTACYLPAPSVLCICSSGFLSPQARSFRALLLILQSLLKPHLLQEASQIPLMGMSLSSPFCGSPGQGSLAIAVRSVHTYLVPQTATPFPEDGL